MADELSSIIGGVIGIVVAPLIYRGYCKIVKRKRKSDAIDDDDDERLTITYHKGSMKVRASVEMLRCLYPLSLVKESDIRLFDSLCEYIDAYYRFRADDKINKKEIPLTTWSAMCDGLLNKALKILDAFVEKVQLRVDEHIFSEFQGYSNAVSEILHEQSQLVQQISFEES